MSPINPAKSESAAEMYCRLMLEEKSGYPLHKPEPGQRHPIEYRKKGVLIGDVGRVTPDGAFDFLFNACVPPDHPINPPTLPDNFEVLHLPPNDLLVHEDFEPDTFLSSYHVNQTKDL